MPPPCRLRGGSPKSPSFCERHHGVVRLFAIFDLGGQITSPLQCLHWYNFTDHRYKSQTLKYPVDKSTTEQRPCKSTHATLPQRCLARTSWLLLRGGSRKSPSFCERHLSVVPLFAIFDLGGQITSPLQCYTGTISQITGTIHKHSNIRWTRDPQSNDHVSPHCTNHCKSTAYRNNSTFSF